MSNLLCFAMGCKAAMIVMFFIAFGILNYQAFNDNEFKRQLVILEDANSSSVGSFLHLQQSCLDFENLVNDSLLKWSFAAIEIAENQIKTCEDLVKMARDFRDLIKDANSKGYLSFPLICLALVVLIISVVIQAKAGEKYAKSFRRLDIIVLGISTLLILVFSCMLFYFASTFCTSIKDIVKRTEVKELEAYTNMLDLSKQLSDDIVEQQHKSYEIWNYRWSYFRVGVSSEDGNVESTVRKESHARLHDCSGEYNTTILTVDGIIGLAIFICLIGTIGLLAIVKPPKSENREQKADDTNADPIVYYPQPSPADYEYVRQLPPTPLENDPFETDGSSSSSSS